MVMCRGIRGATTVEMNTREHIFAATKELFRKIIDENQIQKEEVAAIFFTATRDLNAAFPATAVREMGWDGIPLMCSHEMDVPGSLSSCLRVLVLVNTDREPHELKDVYINGASNLRQDALQQ